MTDAICSLQKAVEDDTVIISEGGDEKSWRNREQQASPKQGGDNWEQPGQGLSPKDAKASARPVAAPQQQQTNGQGEVRSTSDHCHPSPYIWHDDNDAIIFPGQDSTKIVRAADVGLQAYRPGAVVSSEEKVMW